MHRQSYSLNRFWAALSLLLLSLSSVRLQAQQSISWSTPPGVSATQSVTLSPSWTGTATARAYYRPGGPLLPTRLQPAVTRSGNALTLSFANTSALQARTYVTISTGSTVRYAGYLSLGSPVVVTPPTGTTGVTGPIPISSVLNLQTALSDLSGRIDNLTIPTSLSAFINDPGYLSSATGVLVSTYNTNRTLDRNETVNAQNTANTALSTANSAQAGLAGKQNTINFGTGLAVSGSTVSVTLTPGTNTTLTAVSQLANDANYQTANQVQTAGDVRYRRTTVPLSYTADVTDRPALFSGNYLDLTNRPVIFSGNYSDLAGRPALFSGNYNDLAGKPVLFSGSYLDLTNRPTIPTSNSALANDAGYLTGVTGVPASTYNTNRTGDLNSISAAQNTASAALSTANSATATLTGKVDVVAGKGLSANDFTNALLSKLNAISGSNTGDQALSLSGNVLTLSGAGGGSVTLPTSGTGAVTTDAASLTTGTLADARLSNTGTAGTFGSATTIPVITTDAKGRVTGVTTQPFSATAQAAPNFVILSTPTGAALQTAINSATAATTITWVGQITLTADIEIQNKPFLTLDGRNLGSLTRANSGNMIVLRGGSPNFTMRNVALTNTASATANGMFITTEQGAQDGILIEDCSFDNIVAGSYTNAISIRNTGGANDVIIAKFRNIVIRRCKIRATRMGIEIQNHVWNNTTSPQLTTDNILLEENKIRDCGFGGPDGMGISVSGLNRYVKHVRNWIFNCKKTGLEQVGGLDVVIDGNTIIDSLYTSTAIGISDGYKNGSQVGVWTRNIAVTKNICDVKGRGFNLYAATNATFTENIFKSVLANDVKSNDCVFGAGNMWHVTGDFNVLKLDASNRNTITGVQMTTFPTNNGANTSSLIYFLNGSNNNMALSNTLIRPAASYNVHIEQQTGSTNNLIGAAAGSATNTQNNYIGR